MRRGYWVDGGLMLPRTVVSQTQIAVIGELTFAMVGGATLSADVGLTEIDWLGSMRQVEVIVSEGDDALVGTELLVGTALTIDYLTSTVSISTREYS